MTDTQIPIGSSVRFQAKFTLAGEDADPPDVTATITKGATSQTHTMKTGVERMGKGVYEIEARCDRLGFMSVRFTAKGGETHKEEYEIVPLHAKKAAPKIIEERVDWPDGYDRARAIAELGADATRSNAYLLGALSQHIESRRLDAIMRHDDSAPLPTAADEARAQAIVANANKKASALQYQRPDPAASRKAIADARRVVRLDSIRRR